MDILISMVDKDMRKVFLIRASDDRLFIFFVIQLFHFFDIFKHIHMVI
jgi:hypothetical protein